MADSRRFRGQAEPVVAAFFLRDSSHRMLLERCVPFLCLSFSSEAILVGPLCSYATCPHPPRMTRLSRASMTIHITMSSHLLTRQLEYQITRITLKAHFINVHILLPLSKL